MPADLYDGFERPAAPLFDGAMSNRLVQGGVSC